MLYNKEPNMKYTDMAIFFDENFYSENCDEERCYKYMYLLYHMLASKKKYFYRYEDYDEFAIYATNMVYARFIKKREQGLKIKSVLNYIKASLYPLKVGYQRENYKNIINSNVKDINNEKLTLELYDKIQQQYNYQLQDSYIEIFESIPLYIKELIHKTPYKYNKEMCQKLYLSCLISLVKSFTLSNYNEIRYNNKIDNNLNITNQFIFKMLIKERDNSNTLWHLEDSLSDYIKLLTNLIRGRISDELSKIRYNSKLTDETMDNILKSAWKESMLEPTVYDEDYE